MGDINRAISGPTGPTEIVHLSKFAKFNKEKDCNAHKITSSKNNSQIVNEGKGTSFHSCGNLGIKVMTNQLPCDTPIGAVTSESPVGLVSVGQLEVLWC